MQDDYFNGKNARKGRYSMRCSALGRRALRFSVGAALCARNPSLSSSFALFAFHTQLYFTFIILYFHIEGVVGAARLHAILLLHHHLHYLHFILNYIILLSSYYVLILRERFHPPTCNCLFYLKPQVQGLGCFENASFNSIAVIAKKRAFHKKMQCLLVLNILKIRI